MDGRSDGRVRPAKRKRRNVVRAHAFVFSYVVANVAKRVETVSRDVRERDRGLVSTDVSKVTDTKKGRCRRNRPPPSPFTYTYVLLTTFFFLLITTPQRKNISQGVIKIDPHSPRSQHLYQPLLISTTPDHDFRFLFLTNTNGCPVGKYGLRPRSRPKRLLTFAFFPGRSHSDAQCVFYTLNVYVQNVRTTRAHLRGIKKKNHTHTPESDVSTP